MLDSGVEGVEELNLIIDVGLLVNQIKQLRLQLAIKLCLQILNKSLNFPAPIILRLLDPLDTRLHVLHPLLQILEPVPEFSPLLPHTLAVLLINGLQLENLMALMPALQNHAVRADAFGACLAKVGQLRLVLRTVFFPFVLLLLRLDLEQGVLDLVNEPYGNELVHTQGRPAVRALLARLAQPLLETARTREFRARRAHQGLVQV